MSLWDNNEIQFARLICELVANVENLEFELVSESMDLEESELQELYDRAHTVFENVKEVTQDKFPWNLQVGDEVRYSHPDYIQEVWVVTEIKSNEIPSGEDLIIIRPVGQFSHVEVQRKELK